jgi:hypothetical protein
MVSLAVLLLHVVFAASTTRSTSESAGAHKRILKRAFSESTPLTSVAHKNYHVMTTYQCSRCSIVPVPVKLSAGGRRNESHCKVSKVLAASPACSIVCTSAKEVIPRHTKCVDAGRYVFIQFQPSQQVVNRYSRRRRRSINS